MIDDQLRWEELEHGNERAWHRDDIGTYALFQGAVGYFYSSFQREGTPGVGYIQEMLCKGGNYAEAVGAAQDHHARTRREKRWIDYMRDNEPPEVS